LEAGRRGHDPERWLQYEIIFDASALAEINHLFPFLILKVFVKNITRYRSALRFPSDEDLTGAAVALMRLQDTYELDTHALAEGKLLGKKYSRQLTGNYIEFTAQC
jgi:hypothetical protein